MQTAKCLFFAGTDTDVGKTYVSCLVLRQLLAEGNHAGAYKPVASGFPTVDGSDGQRLMQAIGESTIIDRVSPQRFAAPLAPPVAADREGREVDESKILSEFHEWTTRCSLLLVEGAGGLMSPVSRSWTNADLIQRMSIPIVLVSHWRLGVVNQVLTSLVACNSLGIRVRGIVLNDVDGLLQVKEAEDHLQLLCRFLAGKTAWQTIPLLRLKFGQESFEPDLRWNDIFS